MSPRGEPHEIILNQVGSYSHWTFFFGYAEVWGADRKFILGTSTGNWYYDAESITRPSKDVVKVWEKIVYKEKGIIEMVEKFGKKYESVSYSLAVVEFNCAEKQIQGLSLDDYSTDGKKLFASSHLKEKWSFAVPGSVSGSLYGILCK